jgi:hypothetical protein
MDRGDKEMKDNDKAILLEIIRVFTLISIACLPIKYSIWVVLFFIIYLLIYLKESKGSE